MKATEICNTNKKRLQCRCFPVSFTKLLRVLSDRTRPDDCFWILFIHSSVFCHHGMLSPSELIETRFFLFLDILGRLFREIKFLECKVHDIHRKRCIQETLLREIDDPVVAAGKQAFL